MTDPVFSQIMPAGDWLAEYLIGPATAPTGRRYERVVAFVLGSFPTNVGEYYQHTEMRAGIDGFDSQRRLCSTLAGFNRFVRFDDLEPEKQGDVRREARPPRSQAGDPEWRKVMGDDGTEG